MCRVRPADTVEIALERKSVETWCCEVVLAAAVVRSLMWGIGSVALGGLWKREVLKTRDSDGIGTLIAECLCRFSERR